MVQFFVPLLHASLDSWSVPAIEQLEAHISSHQAALTHLARIEIELGGLQHLLRLHLRAHLRSLGHTNAPAGQEAGPEAPPGFEYSKADFQLPPGDYYWVSRARERGELMEPLDNLDPHTASPDSQRPLGVDPNQAQDLFRLLLRVYQELQEDLANSEHPAPLVHRVQGLLAGLSDLLRHLQPAPDTPYRSGPVANPSPLAPDQSPVDQSSSSPESGAKDPQ